MTSPLLKPFHGPTLDLGNRIAMAPMTRGRADDTTGVPTSIMGTYYAQRASAGLIVSEGVWPHRLGKGDPGVPGLTTQDQVAGWRSVTDAVHAAGGRIFAQLWHVGRVNHPENITGAAPPAPSAVRLENGKRIATATGSHEPGAPRALEYAEIQELVEAFASAARHAISAGFDGVELHGANGYLIQQFVADNTNLRSDGYSDRLRFAIEAVEATAAAIGAERVALRISPGNPENAIVETAPADAYRRLLSAIDPLGLAYLHILERGDYEALADLRPRWKGALIGNYNGKDAMTQADGERMLNSGLADIASYGRSFISNPDLPERFASGADLAPVRPGYRYGSSAEGYIDYPARSTVA